MMQQHTFMISDAINTGWKATKKYFRIIMLLGGIVYIPSLVSNLFDALVNYIPGATTMVTNPTTDVATATPTETRSIIIAIVFLITGVF